MGSIPPPPPIIPELSQHNYLKIMSIMSPGVWNATLISCGSSMCRCLSALSANYRWWLVVWGGCAEVLLELSARKETLLKRVKEQARWILPTSDCSVIWPHENGLSLFRGHFPTILPHNGRSSSRFAPLVNHYSCSLLKYLPHPPPSLFPSSALDICSLQAFTVLACILRTCQNVCFSYLLLPNKSVQS